jgi:NAD(P)-dependent dehydrogenase (short-subunit alcohol dehydrogenase family)
MHILVTGGSGAVGRPLVKRLLSHGHHVRILDRNLENSPAGVESLVGAEAIGGDITDFAVVRTAVRGMQAIIHLAAIPNPAGAEGAEIFRINASGTFNVYEAAAQEGIHRVVSASSINALGFNYGIKTFPIEYLPLDEQHPTFTSDPYSFSKGVTEEIAAYYWRREGISGVQLRLPGVIPLTEEFRQMVLQFEPFLQAATVKISEMSVSARQDRARQLVAEIDARRAERFHEKPGSYEMSEGDWPPDMNDPLKLVAFGYTDFWAVITAENSALALELGALADYEGSHPLFVADGVNMLGIEAEILAGAFYPEAARKRPLLGPEPLVSFDRARQLIGYQPGPSLDEWLLNQARPE